MWRRTSRKARGHGRTGRKILPLTHVHFSYVFSLLLTSLLTRESRVRAVRLSLQALAVPRRHRGAAILPGVLVGKVGGVWVGPGRGARGAGEEVAYVGVEGRRGRRVVVQRPAGVRASRGAAGLVVEQRAGGRRRTGRSPLSLAQLNWRDVLALLGGEKGLGRRQRIQPPLGSGHKKKSMQYH